MTPRNDKILKKGTKVRKGERNVRGRMVLRNAVESKFKGIKENKMIMRISNGMDFWWKQPREREKKKV